MESETIDTTGEIKKTNVWTCVTPFSKYLALALFIILPFVGFGVGLYYGTDQKMLDAQMNENLATNQPENTASESSSMEAQSSQLPLDFMDGTDLRVSTDGALIQLSFAQGLEMDIPYPSTWEVDSFEEGEVTKGSGYEILARVDNPATPGKPDTDVPRESIMVKIVDSGCEGSHREVEGVSLYDTGWVEEGFVNVRTLCLASEAQKSLAVIFFSFSQQTESQMDASIKGISFK